MAMATSDKNHPKLEANPALAEHLRRRRESLENRIADRITSFAGSMRFVYIHIVWFGLWIGLGIEAYPYGLLTMIVSLEAIFLSTFVMISQNRADARRQVVVDQQWQRVQLEDRQNQELLDLSNQILALTKDVHASTTAREQATVHGDAAGSENSPPRTTQRAITANSQAQPTGIRAQPLNARSESGGRRLAEF
jgi:uncharacterized membrane protein